MSEPRIFTPLDHDKAIAAGAAQCHQCADGWLQYLINTDEMKCPLCGYSEISFSARAINIDDITA